MEKHDYNIGVLDFIVADKIYFLEINPFGLYDVISKGCKINLDLKIAEYLCEIKK
jgi:hypothetical protein